MAAFILARLLTLLPVLWGVSVVVFLLIHLIPGNALQMFLGTQVDMTPAQMDELRRLFGLTKPLPLQYADWLGRIVRGDFGVSLRTGRPVLPDILARLPVSVELTLLALVFALALALPIGIASAIRRGTAEDAAIRVGGLIGLSIPNFWLATMLLLFLPGRVLPIASIGVYVRFFADPIGNLTVLALPAFSLGVVLTAVLMRFVRSSLLEVLGQDYVRTARAKGLRERLVIDRHALRNALIPVITVVGFQAGYLLGGTVVIEEVFALPGMGRLALNAIAQRDYPVVQGVVLVIAMLFVLTNIAVDVLYAYVDPRVRYR
ncbi:MAG: ABC transporter permease [Bacillati bacterium ANGP1]|uniref:ABC transporter permease n=1 Tax=Candidatus Segetimicrobium genomatis TaxID=2569760 RepID=A0A537K563_9BACT|nr:MAG: ABC transporter permease [Terrabacteria group bacterium ANGP1]